jgi:hypothetical protein
MKTIGIILISTFLLMCKDPLSVSKATSKKWVGGIPEAGTGVIYSVYFKVNKSGVFEVGDMWIDSEHYSTTAFKNNAQMPSSYYEKGDTVVIVGRRNYPPSNPDYIRGEYEIGVDQVKAPKEFSSKALIKYSFRGKIEFIEINEFDELEMDIYQ